MATKKVGALVKEARTGAKLTQEKLGQAAGVTAAEIGKCERGEIDLTNTQLKKIAVACGVTQSSLLNAPKNVSASAAKKAATAKKPAAAAKTTAAKTAAAKKTTTNAKKTTAVKTTTAKTAAAKKTTTAKTAAAKKTTTAKTAAAKKTTAKTTAAKKTTTAKKPAAKKTESKTPAVPASANVSMKVTASEKKLVEAYRGASSDLKKISLKVLKGEYGDTLTNILGVVGGTGSANAADQIGDALGNLLGGLISGK